MSLGAPPPGGDMNRANEVFGFTWSLGLISLFLVVSRMYSRIKLTRNVWWDDWLICFAVVSRFHPARRLILMYPDSGLHHLNNMERLRRQRLCETFVLHSRGTGSGYHQTQHDITSNVHVQYCNWENIRRLLDRAHRRSQPMEEVAASDDISHHIHLGCHHVDTFLRTMQSSKSGLGEGFDKAGESHLLESDPGQYVEPHHRQYDPHERSWSNIY